MKKLLITLLLSTFVFAETTREPNKTPSLMECEMIIEMYHFSIEQGNPVTKVQIMGVIEACNAHLKHQKRVNIMKELLKTL